MTVHITLVTGTDVSWTGNMLLESLGKGILDSACTKTVSGEKWMDEYIRNLNEEDKKKVVCETESKSLFRFGNGVENKGIRNSRPEVFLRKDVLKICNKFTAEYPCRSVISIKLQSNFTEITLRHVCSPINFLHHTFSKNNSGWLLLEYKNCKYANSHW